MKIEPHIIIVRELVEGYRNDEEEGVVAYGGRLDVRPRYQREFIYSDAEQKAVIDTVTKGYPLNVMYWAVRGDGTYEVMDGQQRTLSICEYVAGRFDYFFRFFSNLSKEEQSRILDYALDGSCGRIPIRNHPPKSRCPQMVPRLRFLGKCACRRSARSSRCRRPWMARRSSRNWPPRRRRGCMILGGTWCVCGDAAGAFLARGSAWPLRPTERRSS